MMVRLRLLLIPTVLVLVGYTQPILLKVNAPAIWREPDVTSTDNQIEFPSQYARLHKPWIIAYGAWEGVYIGGSRVFQAIDPAIHQPGRRVYNAGISGPTVRELVSLGRQALYSGVDQLVVSVVFALFLLDSPPNTVMGTGLLGEDDGSVARWLKYSSVAYQSIDMRNGYPVDMMLGRSRGGFSVNGRGVQSQSISGRPCGDGDGDLHRSTINRYHEIYSESKAVLFQRLTDNMRLLEGFLSDAVERGVDMQILVLPVHDSIGALRSINGVDVYYLNWLQGLLDLTQKYQLRPLLLFDAINGVTDVPFSHVGPDLSGVLSGWKDPAHLCQGVGDSLQLSEDSNGWLRPVSLSNELQLNSFFSGARSAYDSYSKHCDGVGSVLDNCFLLGD